MTNEDVTCYIHGEARVSISTGLEHKASQGYRAILLLRNTVRFLVGKGGSTHACLRLPPIDGPDRAQTPHVIPRVLWYWA